MAEKDKLIKELVRNPFNDIDLDLVGKLIRGEVKLEYGNEEIAKVQGQLNKRADLINRIKKYGADYLLDDIYEEMDEMSDRIDDLTNQIDDISFKQDAYSEVFDQLKLLFDL